MKTLINAVKAYTGSQSEKDGKISPIAAKDDMTQAVGVRKGKLWTAPYRLTKSKVIQALGFIPVSAAKVGKAGGIASLNEDRKIPASQIPKKTPDVVLSEKMEVIGEPYAISLLDGDGRIRVESVYPVKIKNSAFSNYDLEISSLPYGTEVIGDYAFSRCSNLHVTELPPKLKTLGYEAFESTCGLVTTKLPDTLESIGTWAFWGCNNVFFREIPESVHTIGARAFDMCEKLTEVTLPKRLTSIGNAPFCRCYNLTAITMAADNPNYSTHDGVLYDKAMKKLIQYPCGRSGAFIVPNGVTELGADAFEGAKEMTELSLPDTLTAMGSSAINGCDALERITIPAGVTTLPYAAFRDCDKLCEVVLQEGLIRISEQAFYFCRSLTQIELPVSVKKIDTNAFGFCTGLSKIWIRKGCETIANGAFDLCSNLTIYCEDTEKPAGWADGFNRRNSYGTDRIPVEWGVTSRPW